MFKKIVNHPGFWRSVVSIGIAFIVLFMIFRWVLDGFSFKFLTENNPWLLICALGLGGFVYGFFVTYGKFWKKLKEKE
ncbi:MAG TPA: hypothetical protein PKW08_01775 [Flavobacteriaceae bacterium]|nr:hypothetical protein [Flavobacteriaceae bacterium]MCB9213060.1 hypothetical protein [Alteromonas sp.]HPF10965.1 hypothetical protein [Flavobacteriaceae bacterium]HQU20293.1 hypothetical protein [Flavobacteriaceae bacterium]HQU64185.1 hypothetical protein [Flavobacteriaceae bacterium]